MSKVCPSRGMANNFYAVLDNEEGYKKKHAWGYIVAQMSREERVLFKKWWNNRGVYDYAKWLVKNNRAWIHEDREGDLVVNSTNSKGNYIFWRKRKTNTKRKAG